MRRKKIRQLWKTQPPSPLQACACACAVQTQPHVHGLYHVSKEERGLRQNRGLDHELVPSTEIASRNRVLLSRYLHSDLVLSIFAWLLVLGVLFRWVHIPHGRERLLQQHTCVMLQAMQPRDGERGTEASSLGRRGSLKIINRW